MASALRAEATYNQPRPAKASEHVAPLRDDRDMMTYWQLRGEADVWPGIVGRSLLIDSQWQAGNYLADMAAKGNWPKVMQELNPDNHLLDVKQWRPGDRSCSTVLHQAATGGASSDVLSWLIGRGALRSQEDADGRTAYDMAALNGASPELLELLTPPPSPLEPERIETLNAHLAVTIDELIQPLFGSQDLRRLFRYPPVGVLHEVPGQELWLQVPNLMGGVRVILRRGYLELLFGYRRFGESGEVHVTTAAYLITHRGVLRVYDGYLTSAPPVSDPE
ncbi:ankyrin repeat domain-containing protein [[Mycobacterium] nativiensis]|uniref:Ankyrin repeat domain-containing protein n=1 Tax=[Mycobacterium] nativiensis TaxID=2855503 RepID=A0ABU5XWB5_9MYCO|nr:ankyrin repeat domain-containing protein [Mycolicibacter sp. MYC340]MEB3032077.1 ankyrin repeat domain-containing protein [Mycolicibacter sp. MYC340]